MSFSKIEWLAEVRRSKIPADQQRVISEIGDTANRDGLGAWKYTGELADALGVQPRTVTNARRAGVDAGFLIVTREPPRGRPSKQVKLWTTEYRLAIPGEKVGTQIPASGEKVGTQIPASGEKVGTQIPASVRSTHESRNVDSTPSGISSGFYSDSHPSGESGARTDEREPLDVEPVPDPVDGPPPTGSSEQSQLLDVEPVEPASREVVVQRNGGLDETAGEVVDAAAGPDNLPAVNGKPKSDRGTRLPDDWMPERAVIDQMRAEHPDVDLRAEHAKFVDYWASVPGAKGRKVDWNRTWRNWIRKAAEYAGPARRNGSAVEDKVSGWLKLRQRIESDDEGGAPW